MLTHTDAPASLLRTRLDAAVAAECPGIVCAAADLATIREGAPDIFAVTPGIRLPGGDTHDQVRIATPADAIARGADLLVVGRAVTGAADPTVTAADVAAEVHAALQELAH